MSLAHSLSPAGRVALAALGLSALVLVREIVHALRLEPLPTNSAPAEVFQIPDLDQPRAFDGAALVAAVGRNPFRPERVAALGRYRMPGESPAEWPSAYASAATRPSADRTPFVELQGVVTLARGEGLAALSVPGGATRVVRVGQTFEGFRLTRVSAGSVTMVGSDTTLTLRLRERDLTLRTNARPR
jgi:hypothetical protein